VEKDSAFTGGRRAHKTLWVELAKMLGEHGYNVTGDNCANKWKSLKMAYKDVVDHNSKTGNDPKTCAFFETFNVLCGYSPSTRPQFTLDSSTSGIEEDGLEDVEMRPDKKRKVAGRKCREKKDRGATLEWLNSWKEDDENRKKEKEDATERRHEDKMSRFDRLLDILDN
jgi:hypothetical protein